MKKILAFMCVLLLMCTVVVAAGEVDDCGFFCKIGRFMKNIFGGSDSTSDTGSNAFDGSSSSGSEGGAGGIAGAGQGPPLEVPETDTTVVPEPVDVPATPDPVVEPVKTPEEEIEEQIEIVDERAAETILTDINVRNPKCTIHLAKDEVKGNENVKVDVTFTDESLKYKRVSISCDQFERYGKSSDEPYKTAVSSSLKIDDTNCDWGDVTTKTVYFVIVADEDDNDICAAPITVIPKNEDLSKLGANGCFTDEALAEMKQNCGDLEPFSLPDANGCETVYCASGEISQCTPEPLLEKAALDCEANGENFLAYKYSETFEGQDWPCGQIRCSECPSQEELDIKRTECLNRGEGWAPARQIDHELTGCPYIICNEPNSGSDTEENVLVEDDIQDLPPE